MMKAPEILADAVMAEYEAGGIVAYVAAIDAVAPALTAGALVSLMNLTDERALERDIPAANVEIWRRVMGQ
jgi:hypothetical protein